VHWSPDQADHLSFGTGPAYEADEYALLALGQLQFILGWAHSCPAEAFLGLKRNFPARDRLHYASASL
jgi:hypothetical protein